MYGGQCKPSLRDGKSALLGGITQWGPGVTARQGRPCWAWEVPQPRAKVRPSPPILLAAGCRHVGGTDLRCGQLPAHSLVHQRPVSVRSANPSKIEPSGRAPLLGSVQGDLPASPMNSAPPRLAPSKVPPIFSQYRKSHNKPPLPPPALSVVWQHAVTWLLGC